MPAVSRVRRLRDAVQTLGVRRLAPSLLRWVVRREFVVFARDLLVLSPDEASDPSMRWTDLSAHDTASLLEIDSALDETDLARRQREGQYCRLGWAGARLAHYRWDTLRPAYLPYLDRWYQPQPGDVLTTWLYTTPDQRGRGVQRASHADLREQALARGCRRSLGIVAVWNVPSLRTNDHTGRVRVGTVGYVALGPWRRYFATGLAYFDSEGRVAISRARPSWNPSPPTRPEGPTRNGRAWVVPTPRDSTAGP
jgi:GNAT superfamily N-acetyltransferase